jgi:hypothetical protein
MRMKRREEREGCTLFPKFNTSHSRTNKGANMNRMTSKAFTSSASGVPRYSKTGYSTNTVHSPMFNSRLRVESSCRDSYALWNLSTAGSLKVSQKYRMPASFFSSSLSDRWAAMPCEILVLIL